MVVATSLARQVEDLKGRATGTDVRAVQRGRGRASLLFTPGEGHNIGNYDRLSCNLCSFLRVARCCIGGMVWNVW